MKKRQTNPDFGTFFKNVKLLNIRTEKLRSKETGRHNNRIKHGTPKRILESKENINGKTGKNQMTSWVQLIVRYQCQFLGFDKHSMVI